MIPKYEQIMLPFLNCLSDGNEHKLGDLVEELANQFQLTDEERRTLLPSGKQALFRNRVGWARTYLNKAALIETVKRAHFRITDRGRKVLKESPEEITAHYLTQFEEFVEFITPKAKNGDDEVEKTIQSSIEFEDQDKTPEEAFEYAFQNIKSKLAKELLSLVKECSSSFFENLVVDLLIQMGYGGSRKDAGEAMGKSGDGGIDGIIKEDKLGLDIIYIQAKKWDNTVPIKEVRDFAGALLSKKARKGIMIATSSFPKSAYEFVSQIEPKIVLIDGYSLTRLMIENNVGLYTSESYEIKRIDSDYFEEN